MFKFIGNILWLIFGGLINVIAWTFIGVLYCLTIVGIPIGLQCFKIARLSFWPMGKEVEVSLGGGNILLNIFWLIFGGVEIAGAMILSGIFLCLTIVGIPFGKQQFKLAKLALLPFGAQIYDRRQNIVYQI